MKILQVRRKTLTAAAGVSAVAIFGASIAAVLSASSAFALPTGPSLGTLYFSPNTGTSITNFTLDSDGACPTSATNISAVVNDTTGTWTDVLILSNTSNGISTTGPMSVGVSNNLYNIATANSLPLKSGTYTITLRCTNRLQTSNYGTFSGSLALVNSNVSGTPSGTETYTSTPQPGPTPSTTTTTTTAPPTTTTTTPPPTTSTTTTAPPTTSTTTTAPPTTTTSTTTTAPPTTTTSTTTTAPPTTTTSTTTTAPPTTSTTTTAPPTTSTTTTAPPTTSTTTTTAPSPSTTTTSSSAPNPAASLVVRDVSGNVIPDGSTLKPGQQLNVEGDGYTPGGTVDAVVASTPTTVATAQVDSSGHVSLSAVLPSNLQAGTHTLTVSGAGSSAVFRFTVVSAGGTSDPAPSSAGSAGSGTALAFTGTNAAELSLTGFGLLGVGACALVAARRLHRRPARRH